MNERERTVRFGELLVILFLCIAGVIFSTLSLDTFIGTRSGLLEGGSFCNLNERFNCDAVNKSAWSTLFGLPIAAWGLGFYLLIGIFAALVFLQRSLATRKVFFDLGILAGSLSVLYSLFLFLISELVIGTLCVVCVGMYLVNIGLFLFFWRADRTSRPLERLKRSVGYALHLPRLCLIGFVRDLPQDSPERGVPPKCRRGVFLIVLIFVFAHVVPTRLILVRYSQRPDSAVLGVVKEWSEAPAVQFPPASSSVLETVYRRGVEGAPVRIVEFFDYECPACRTMHRVLEEILSEYNSKVNLTIRNYPLDQSCNTSILESFHNSACLAAEIARCAGEQGLFWEASDLLFELDELEQHSSPSSVQDAALQALEQGGADRKALESCLISDRQIAAIQRDIGVANAFNLQGTPTFYVNDRLVSKIDLSGVVLRKIIERALQSQNEK